MATFPFANFEEYGVRRHSIAAALRDLKALGFIDIKPGQGGNGEFRQPNLFRLTHRQYGHDKATDEWRNIETFEDARRKLKDHPPIGTLVPPPETASKPAKRRPPKRHRKELSSAPETSPLSRAPLGSEYGSEIGSSDELTPGTDQLADGQRPVNADGSPTKVLH
jgi:hypothetical protein